MRTNKFNAKKTKVDGIVFDSKKEARYYEELKERKKKGEIKDFEIKPKIELQPSFADYYGKRIRAINIEPDFLIYHDNYLEYVDTKGYWTDISKLKWKMVQYKFRGKNVKFRIV